MAPGTTLSSEELGPRPVHVLAPRMSPIITDGVVSIVLTDDYRLNPYVKDRGSDIVIRGIVIIGVASVPLKYVVGTGLDPTKMWLSEPLIRGLRTMEPDWVLFFDCNPDLVLARSQKVQNSYLATRDQLGLPELRWAADLRFMAERHTLTTRAAGKALSVPVQEKEVDTEN
ncbi:hypothetical protein EJ07DRAFT_158639 [Lizonia empirigonia]|nr:hypothetical protein EJ07DRAFT_158639 [Lizonia empirigonia]